MAKQSLEREVVSKPMKEDVKKVARCQQNCCPPPTCDNQNKKKMSPKGKGGEESSLVENHWVRLEPIILYFYQFASVIVKG